MSNRKKTITYWWVLAKRLGNIYKATDDDLLKHVCGKIIHDGNSKALLVAANSKLLTNALLSWIKLAEYVLQKEKI